MDKQVTLFGGLYVRKSHTDVHPDYWIVHIVQGTQGRLEEPTGGFSSSNLVCIDPLKVVGINPIPEKSLGPLPRKKEFLDLVRRRRRLRPSSFQADRDFLLPRDAHGSGL